MTAPLSVYISGPYTQPDPAANTHRALAMWHRFADAGLRPYCPHLTHFLHLQSPRHYEHWMTQDLYWVAKCDVLVRLAGTSSGADREVAAAERLGIPVLVADTDDELVEQVLLFRAAHARARDVA